MKPIQNSKKLAPALALSVLLGLFGLSACGAEGTTIDTAPQVTRPVADVKAARLPPLHFRELPSGDLAASLDAGVYFQLGSAELTAKARSRLERALAPEAERFLAAGGAAILVRGYTDGLGSSDYNLDLSRARARSVAALLAEAGIDLGKIRVSGFGERGAEDEVEDPSARRVVVVLHGGA